MDLAQRIARNALLPLLFAALTSPAVQAAGITSSRDLAASEFASRQAHAITLAQPEAGAAADNLAFVTQVGDNLTGDITQVGNALEAFILQSGSALEASLVQYGSHNQGLIIQDGADNQARIEQYGAYNNALIEQTGTGHRSRVTQNGQGLNVVVRQYR